jgi:hypothetical protein
LIIAIMFVLVAVPLTTSSVLLLKQRSRGKDVQSASKDWARNSGGRSSALRPRDGRTVVRLTGPLPIPDPELLRDAIAASGADATAVRAEFIPAESVDFGDAAG